MPSLDFNLHERCQARHDERWHDAQIVGKAYDEPRRFNILLGSGDLIKDITARHLRKLERRCSHCDRPLHLAQETISGLTEHSWRCPSCDKEELEE